MKNIILLAPPAAGKGTLSEQLVKKYGYAHISTGDLLREEVNSGSDLGCELKALMAEGKLVSDDLVLTLIEKRIKRDDSKNGYILDGFPRTINQAEKYDEMLEKLGKDLGVVIYINIDKELAMKRACSRYSCPKCGKVYNINSEELKPKKDGYCDICDEKLIQRPDDTKETFIKRFDEYNNKTMPLYDYYKKKGVLIKINAYESMHDTFNEADNVLRK